VAENHPRLAATLADPAEYNNLFPGLKESEVTERYLTQERRRKLPAKAYPTLTVSNQRVYLLHPECRGRMSNKSSQCLSLCCSPTLSEI